MFLVVLFFHIFDHTIKINFNTAVNNVYLGLSHNPADFNCLDIENDKIFIVRHAKFHEDTFPFKSYLHTTIQPINFNSPWLRLQTPPTTSVSSSGMSPPHTPLSPIPNQIQYVPTTLSAPIQPATIQNHAPHTHPISTVITSTTNPPQPTPSSLTILHRTTQSPQ